MSRVGNNPVAIPKGVKVSIDGQVAHVEGPKGKLDFTIDDVITAKVEGEEVICTRADDEKYSRAIHGTVAATLRNMVKGVSEGFTTALEIVGVGYRVEQKGKDLNLLLGFSHPVVYEAPEGITLKADSQTKIVISGADKQMVGQCAAEIRKYRRPEPYKGKGIRYEGEYVRRKQGKKTGK